MRKVFKWRNVQLWGSSASSVGGVDYLILLTESRAQYAPISVSYEGVPKKLQKLLPKVKHPKIIHIPIKDFSVPAVPASFFADVVRAIARYHKSKSIVNVCVACGAGHGRTGVVLAALAYLLGVTKHDPVAFIRAAYSAEAVETKEQIDWLASELGVKIVQKPSSVTHERERFRGGQTTKQPPVFGWRRDNNEDW